MAEGKDNLKPADIEKIRGQQENDARNWIGDKKADVDRIQKGAELTPKPIQPKDPKDK